MSFSIFFDFAKSGNPVLLVRQLAAHKAQIDFDLVAVEQEATSMTNLHIDVVIVRAWSHLDLFHRDHGLFFLGFFFFLFVFILPLAVIHDFASGRSRGGRDLKKIQTSGFGDRQRFTRGHHSDHLSRLVDQAHLLGEDLTVDPKAPVITLSFAEFVAITESAAAAASTAGWTIKWTNC